MNAAEWVLAALITSPAWVVAVREGCAELRFALIPSDRWGPRPPAELAASSIPPARGLVLEHEPAAGEVA